MESKMKSLINGNVKDIWNIITNNYNIKWREDLSKVETIDEKKFIEYSKDGFETKFEIIEKEEFKCYEAKLENKNLKGEFKVNLKVIEENITEFTLIEKVEVESIFMKILAKPYLKQQQKKYIKNLKIELENTCRYK